jgi:predicted transcriptional regulator
VRQNLTVNLDRETVLKAKVLAARRGTSISALLGQQIEALVDRDETYERAKAQALAFLDKGFHLGGERVADREQLHER